VTAAVLELRWRTVCFPVGMLSGLSPRRARIGATVNTPFAIRVVAVPSRGAGEDVRSLARRDMRHRDIAGLMGLMDEYFALADELEELPGSDEGSRSSKRAA
jgi:hypothetical protein